MLSKEYIAGFFDGEGCITIKKADGYYRLVVQISQKDPIVLGWILIQYPESDIRRLEFKTEKGLDTFVYKLLFNGKNAKRFLFDMQDICINKKEQIKLAIEFLSKCFIK